MEGRTMMTEFEAEGWSAVAQGAAVGPAAGVALVVPGVAPGAVAGSAAAGAAVPGPAAEPRAMWGVLEIFGHRRVAGRISEVQRFGQTMAQVEVFGRDGDRPVGVQLYGAGAIFGMHSCSEERARATGAEAMRVVEDDDEIAF